MAKTLDQRLEEARARRKAAEGAITAEDKAEIAKREEMAREEAAAEAAEQEKRGLDLARRLEVAKDRIDGPVRELAIKDSAHTFVIKDAGAAAYNTWERGVAKSVTADVTGNGKVDRAAVSRTYAVAAVEDWNGIIDFGPSATNGQDLITFLTSHPAIVSEIVNVAVELAKQAKEARKSSG